MSWSKTSSNVRRLPVLSTDREQFEVQFAVLCAGYNLPVTKARMSAYWSGLTRMSLPRFSRCIEFALGEEGPDDIPTSKGIWKIHRQLSGSAGGPSVHTSAKPSEPDHLEYMANRLLYVHALSRGGLGPMELQACLKFKRSLVNWYLGPVREGDPDATPAECLRQWIAGLQACSRIEKAIYNRWCEMLEGEALAKPFDPSMARELTTQPAQMEFA
jgi:hypothetical protein